MPAGGSSLRVFAEFYEQDTEESDVFAIFVYQNRQRSTGSFRTPEKSARATFGTSMLLQGFTGIAFALLILPSFRLNRMLQVENTEAKMIRRLIWITVAILLYVPLTQAFGDENGGKELYLKYCASCHGNQGKGDGPVGRDLKVRVPDLTVLRSKNRSIYPLDRVMSSIDGSRVVRTHGTRTMPVWGEVFRKENEKEKYTELTSLLKAKLIAEYVGTLQK